MRRDGAAGMRQKGPLSDVYGFNVEEHLEHRGVLTVAMKHLALYRAFRWGGDHHKETF